MYDTRTQSTNRGEATGLDVLNDNTTDEGQVQRTKYSCLCACMPGSAVIEEGDWTLLILLRGNKQVAMQSWAMDLH